METTIITFMCIALFIEAKKMKEKNEKIILTILFISGLLLGVAILFNPWFLNREWIIRKEIENALNQIDSDWISYL